MRARTDRALGIAALAALSACGGAQAATRDFPVGPFDRISNATAFDVRVHVGGRPAVRATGSDAALAHLQVGVVGGSLTITNRPGNWWENGRVRQQIDVSVPALSGVAVSGPGSLTVDRARADHFTVGLDGPGDVTVNGLAARSLDVALHGPGGVRLAGRADTATIALHGPGDIVAGDLALRDAAVTLDGPGGTVLRATGTVHGTLSGPGDLSVRGGARCQVAKSGPGDVTCG